MHHPLGCSFLDVRLRDGRVSRKTTQMKRNGFQKAMPKEPSIMVATNRRNSTLVRLVGSKLMLLAPLLVLLVELRKHLLNRVLHEEVI